MTAQTSPFDSFRPALLGELRKAVDGLAFSHAAPLREAVAALVDDSVAAEAALLPSLLCLLTADALGASSDAALPAATSLALLASMGSVFGEIAGAAAAGSVSERWGLPRALNAGDGFYALAQASLAGASSSAETILDALDLLDAAGRSYSEELHAGAGALSPALLSAGAALGALFSGADRQTVAALGEYGRSLAGGPSASLGAVSISDAARARLVEAAGYVARFR